MRRLKINHIKDLFIDLGPVIYGRLLPSFNRKSLILIKISENNPKYYILIEWNCAHSFALICVREGKEITSSESFLSLWFNFLISLHLFSDSKSVEASKFPLFNLTGGAWLLPSTLPVRVCRPTLFLLRFFTFYICFSNASHFSFNRWGLRC